MKNLLLFLSFIFFFDTINANSYQRDVWKFLDKSYKSLLTDPKQAVDYTLQAFDIPAQIKILQIDFGQIEHRQIHFGQIKLMRRIFSQIFNQFLQIFLMMLQLIRQNVSVVRILLQINGNVILENI